MSDMETGDHWKSKCLKKLLTRNKVEAAPFRDILATQNDNWIESNRLQRIINTVSHILNEVQHNLSVVLMEDSTVLSVHETNIGSTNKVSSKDNRYVTVIEQSKLQLSEAQSSLREKFTFDKKVRSDLNNKIVLQNRLILAQREEIFLAKHELEKRMEQILLYEERIQQLEEKSTVNDWEKL
jgi:hypothetical protein